MTVSKLFSVLLLSILIAISSVYTQESSAFKWGIGVASPFVQSQYVIPAYPNTVISIPMFFSRQFKLEPFISYSDFTDEQKREDETPYTLDVNYQNVEDAIGDLWEARGAVPDEVFRDLVNQAWVQRYGEIS